MEANLAAGHVAEPNEATTEASDRPDFFWFWRNIGLSGKTGDDLGRWGLGKTVYRAASRVGCMFGLTVRDSDARKLLMGQGVLHIHAVDGVEYFPEGFWCGQTARDGLPLAIESPEELSTFCSEWKLTRTTEPGLSVVVPYVASELSGMRMMQAVCIHFFLPILRGELEVEIAAPDIKTGRACLTATTLNGWCSAVKWDGPKRSKRHVAPPIDFVQSCLKSAIKHETRLLGISEVPVLNESGFEQEDLESLRKSHEEETLTAVRIRINLPRKTGTDLEGQMSVFLQRQATDQRFDTYYVREGMTITKLNSKAAMKGIQALVLVDKGPLAQLLGDSEGPAHEDWNTSAERPDKTWKRGWKGRIGFCRKIVDALLEVLQPPTRKADFNLLSDFFSVEEFASPQKARRPDANGEGEPAFGAIVPTPRWYRLDPRRGGFRIASSTTQPVPENAELTVSVAYDVPSGNPLKKWSPFDFDFQKKPPRIVFLGQNVTPKAIAGNVLKLTFSDSKFSFAAEGFDQHTDLYVRIEEAGAQSAAAEPTDGDET